MYWIFIFFLFVIVLMVIYTHRAKAEKESHNWLNEENHVDEKPKIKMQELACCHTTFYDSTDPARIEKAYREACERGGREGFFPVLLVLKTISSSTFWTNLELRMARMGLIWQKCKRAVKN